MQSYKRFLPYLIIVVILLVAGGASWYFYRQYQVAKNPNAAAQLEVSQLVTSLGKVMELPKEQPTVATVSDKSKLQNQNFFVKAENGDKVVIFATAKKAILFRPSTNKIIEVAPINVNAPQPTQSASLTTQTFRAAFYNGTSTSGLTTSAEKRLMSTFANATILVKENASK